MLIGSFYSLFNALSDNNDDFNSLNKLACLDLLYKHNMLCHWTVYHDWPAHKPVSICIWLSYNPCGRSFDSWFLVKFSFRFFSLFRLRKQSTIVSGESSKECSKHWMNCQPIHEFGWSADNFAWILWVLIYQLTY